MHCEYLINFSLTLYLNQLHCLYACSFKLQVTDKVCMAAAKVFAPLHPDFVFGVTLWCTAGKIKIKRYFCFKWYIAPPL